MKTSDNHTKRYYWLKLKDNFFDREEIQLIESLPNGKEYVLILLKFMMKAINSDGRLVVKDVIPYNPQMLATVTHSNVDTVRSAIDIFIKFGLMSTLDDGTLYMNEVQALLGSETEFAAKKREYRQNIKTQSKQLSNNIKTSKDIVQDNVRQESRDKSLENKENPPVSLASNIGGGSNWLEIASSSQLVFDSNEESAIIHWSEYLSSKQRSLNVIQIKTCLLNLYKLKTDGYDICAMINDTIVAGYNWLLKPTPIYLQTKPLDGLSSIKKKSAKYSNPEYFTPENKTDKLELRNYIERCYMFDRVDPRTGLPLTHEQKLLLKCHFDSLSCKSMSVTDYIYQNEVLSGISLLEQSIEDKSLSSISSVA